MSNSKTVSTEIITIAGGTYHEIILYPGNHQVYGSAGRAASALATLGVNVDLYTYADEVVDSVLRERACFENFTLHTNEVRESVIFHYEHGLAEPRIFNYPDTPYPAITVKAPCILRYGMLEGSAVIDAEYAVYDPQNVTNPEPFTANGSRAKHLALILNRYEAKTLSGQSELSDREHAEFLYESGHAEVIIIKQGPAGALICDKGKISYIPAYETSRVNKIGSGDAFVAYFSREWMLNKKQPTMLRIMPHLPPHATAKADFFLQQKGWLLSVPAPSSFLRRSLRVATEKSIWLAPSLPWHSFGLLSKRDGT